MTLEPVGTDCYSLSVSKFMINSVIKVLFTVLVTVVFSGCGTIIGWGRADIMRLERNLLQWNTIAAGKPELPVIPPVGRLDSPTLKPLVREMNALFDIAFRVMVGMEAADGTDAAGRAGVVEIDPVLNERIADTTASLVRIAIDRETGDDNPFVYGLLLDRSGWVLTVKHPFVPQNTEMTDVYLSGLDGTGGYPMVYRFVDTDTDLMLARFNLADAEQSGPPAGTVSPLLEAAPRFAIPREGDAVWVADPESQMLLTVLGVGQPLSLGDERVYKGNIVTDAPEGLFGYRSGAPLFGRDGAIHGLYYHRSLDGTTGGFAALMDLPRQVGRIVLEYLTRGASPGSVQ